jgi:hypothetical protein
MTEREFVEHIARDYRMNGYVVILHPDKDNLPPGLEGRGIDMIAEGKGEKIAVQLKSRYQLVDLDAVRQLEEQMKGQPGWRLELIVVPPEDGSEVPRNGTEADTGYIRSMMDEVTAALVAHLLRSAFIMAWAAAEAALREVAREQGLTKELEAPRFLLKTVYSNGGISREDYDGAEQAFQVRNVLVHGFRPVNLQRRDVEFLLDFTNRLLKTPQGG